MNENSDWIRISQLLAFKKTGAISRSEQNELNAWVSASPKHGQFYEGFLKKNGLEAKKHDTDHAMSRIEGGIRAVRKRRILISSLTGISVTAAAIACIIALRIGGSSEVIRHDTDTDHVTLSMGGERPITLEPSDTGDEWMEYVKSDGRTDGAAADKTMMTVTVPRGKEYKLRMPDNSVVWLNSESSIEYPSDFSSDRRNVAITGEAFFDIVPDPSRPFEISTHDGLTITVLGTRFNVNSYADVDETSVSLVEGSVRVAHNDNSLVLSPNQQAVFDRITNGLSSRDIPDAAVHAAWINGIFDFKNEPIEVIFNAMSKWYNISFDTADLDLRSLGHFTISIPRGESFSHTAEILRKITGLEFHMNDGVIHVRR